MFKVGDRVVYKDAVGYKHVAFHTITYKTYKQILGKEGVIVKGPKRLNNTRPPYYLVRFDEDVDVDVEGEVRSKRKTFPVHESRIVLIPEHIVLWKKLCSR